MPTTQQNNDFEMRAIGLLEEPLLDRNIATTDATAAGAVIGTVMDGAAATTLPITASTLTEADGIRRISEFEYLVASSGGSYRVIGHASVISLASCFTLAGISSGLPMLSWVGFGFVAMQAFLSCSSPKIICKDCGPDSINESDVVVGTPAPAEEGAANIGTRGGYNLTAPGAGYISRVSNAPSPTNRMI